MRSASVLTAATAVCAILLAACQESAVQSPEKQTAQEASGARKLSEIQVGSGSITFFANGEYLSFLEKRDPNSNPIIGKELEGLTFAEIHQRLAPGSRVPDELLKSKDTYLPTDARQSDVMPAGDHMDMTREILPLAKSADLNDVWFQTNYCNPVMARWSGYKACLLNRRENGDWAQAGATRSEIYIYPYMGSYIHLNGQCGGSNVFDADLPAGSVYRYYIWSGTAWYGCRATKTHRYNISHTSGSGWHWVFGSHTDC